MGRDVLAAALEGDADAAGPSVLAAQHALRSKAGVVHDERRLGLAARERQAVAQAEAAAVAAGAARALGQRVLVEQDRKLLLQDLDRRRLGDADSRAAIAQPVMVDVAAV